VSITKFFALSVATMAMSCAFADAANVLVSFSTTADKYADGTAVKDGEWYALCWSADGVFEGLKLDATPVDANDLVCLMAPLAKDGKCPYTVFQIDSQSPNCKRTGKYAVVMLDTRGVGDLPAKAGADGKPTIINGAVVAADYQAGSATSGTGEGSVPEGAAWGETSVAEGTKQPVIKGFQVIGNAKVQIDVEDMLPNLRYNVKMGPSVDKLENYGLETPAVGADKASFIVDAKDAKFFQVTRQPLKK